MSNKIVINDFQGGIAETPESQVANQFGMGMGLDINTPNLLTVNQALKAYGNTVLKKVFSVGGRTHGYLNTVLRYFSSTNFVFEHTNTKGNFINAIPARSHIVYTTPSRLGVVASPFNATGYNDSVGILDSISGEHPMLEWGGDVYVGDTDGIGKWDFSTYQADLFPIAVGYYVADLIANGNYIAILLRSNLQGKPSQVYWWDGHTEWYNYALEVPFLVTSLGKIENNLVGFCNEDGSAYLITQSGWSPLSNKTLARSSYDESNYMAVWGLSGQKPVCQFKNKLLYSGSGSPATYNGVWSIGRPNTGSPFAVNWEWRVQSGSPLVPQVVQDISNSFPVRYGLPNIFVSMVDGAANKRIMTIDYANKNADSYYESLILDGGAPTISKRFDYVTIETKPLPASTSFTIYKKVNGETAWVLVGTYSTTGRTKQTFPIPNSNVGENIQIQFNFTVSGNTAPSIKSYSIDYVPIRK